MWPGKTRSLTCATVAVTAAIIKTEKIHNILWWQRELVKSIPRPERRVAGHSLPAVLLDPVQVEHGVPRVSSVLNNNFLVETFCVHDNVCVQSPVPSRHSERNQIIIAFRNNAIKFMQSAMITH